MSILLSDQLSKVIILADDLSGAAELAGIAFAHGLSAEVRRMGYDYQVCRVGPAIADRAGPSTQVLAIDTDSRHLESTAAAARVKQITEQIAATNPAWLYKKVDSVLRGNVRAEIEAILQVTRQSRALLVPANPSRGRIIQGGEYFIDGVPLQQTPFACDSDHPRSSSDVATLLGSEGKQTVHTISADETLPSGGFIVPDATREDDLFRRAISADANTLLAGAADFFATLLHQRYQKGSASALPSPISLPALLVCGSRAAWPVRRHQCAAAGIRVLAIESGFQTSASDCQNLLIGISESERADTKLLLSFLARCTKFLIENSSPRTILAEGGATAAAIANEMQWHRFDVVATAPAGVGVLQPLASNAPLFLIKPGSYPWPPEIWQAFCRCKVA